ncbi:hypothetical protein GCM10027418_20190 [Mariniluteicoccus endophyticus]
MPGVALALREAVRVLRPSGRPLLADHVVSASAPGALGAARAGEGDDPVRREVTRRPAPLPDGPGLQVVERLRSTPGALEQVRAVRS